MAAAILVPLLLLIVIAYQSDVSEIATISIAENLRSRVEYESFVTLSIGYSRASNWVSP